MLERISRMVDSEKKGMLSLLSDLISKKTENPPGNEYLAARVVEKFFRKWGIRYKTFEKKKGRTNILGYIGREEPELLIACHLDTVPAGEGWKTDPFKAVVSKGRVYGRGAADNKGSMASMLIAGKILKKFESELKGQVILACVADEEKGSLYGMKYLLRDKKIKLDYAIIPDVERNMKKIFVAEKGALFLKITSFGKQAHGSTPDRGVNAVWNMIDFLNLFRKYRMKYKNDPLFKEPARPTKNLGVISGGVSANVVPAKCEAKIDIRYLPNQNAEKIIKDIKKMLEMVRKKNRNAKFLMEIKNKHKPVKLDRDNVLVRILKKNAKSVLGTEPGIYGMSGSTVVKPLVEGGILSVGFGPGDPVAHMANEYMHVKEMLDFSKILCLTALDLLK